MVVGGSMEGCGEPESRTGETEHERVFFPEGYVGVQKCASCHDEQFQDWQGSHHQMAMLPAGSESVLGDFGGVSFDQDVNPVKFFMDGEKDPFVLGLPRS